MDHVVGEIERDFVELEIRVLDVFAEDGVTVSVTASRLDRHRGGAGNEIVTFIVIRSSSLAHSTQAQVSAAPIDH